MTVRRLHLKVEAIVDAEDARDAIGQIFALLRDDEDSIDIPVWSLTVDAAPTTANCLSELGHP